jgi:hypothetical protein
MVKQARLHDGTVLEFPDDASDGIIDKAVREYLKLPEPVDYEKAEVEAIQSVASATDKVASNTLKVAQSNKDVAEAVANLVQKDVFATLMPALERITRILERIANKPEDSGLAEAINNLAVSTSAPRRIETTRDNSGKLMSATIVSE